MALQDLCSTSLWVRFFTESGIPHSVAANYAVTFVENRITRNMLLDLNKEILQDMGIAVMGDVIAILKHAKVVHAQITREKVYQNEPSVASVFPVAQARRSTSLSATRIIPDMQVAERPIVADLIVPAATLKRTAHQRIVAPPATIQEQPPAKKPRRVLPEHEGPYKISMPSGTTPKTRKLLAQLSTKESVFERLGDETSSATKQPKAAITVAAKHTKTKTMATPSSTSSSVFQRLGPGKSDAECDVNQREDILILPQMKSAKKRVVLQPAKVSTMRSVKPILKKRLGPKVAAVAAPITFKTSTASPVVRFSATASAPHTSSQGILAKRNLSKVKSIYSRLGDKAVQRASLQKATVTTKKTISTVDTNKIVGLRAGLPRVTILGMGTSATTASGKSSVFRRLGPAVDV